MNGWVHEWVGGKDIKQTDRQTATGITGKHVACHKEMK